MSTVVLRQNVPWLQRVALTIGIGIAGAALFDALALPLPIMLGSMAAVASTAIAGVRLAFPPVVKTFLIGLLGIALGETFTPDLVNHAGVWSLSFAFVMVSNAAMAAVVVLALRRWTNYDRVTAYFSGMPGALTQILVLAPEKGADMPTVSLSHGIRVLMMMLAIPAAAAGMFDHGPLAAASSFLEPASSESVSWISVAFGAAIVVGLSIAGQWLGGRCRLPGPALLGPLCLAAGFGLAGVNLPPVPSPAIAAAQFAMGVATGLTFVGADRLRLRRVSGVALLVVGFMIAWSIAAAIALARALAWSLPVCLLLLAPGGLAEMGVVALALGLEPDKVAAHQALRTAAMVVLVPLVWEFMARYARNAARRAESRVAAMVEREAVVAGEDAQS